MTDIATRLREMGNAPFLEEAARTIEDLRAKVAYWHGLYSNTLEEDNATIDKLVEENERFRNRLEVTHVYDEMGHRIKADLPPHLDAVACRDETIKMLEGQLDRARSQAAGIIEHAYDLTRQIKEMRAEIIRLRVEAGYD